ncbi:hypothetical protein CXR04_13795 [Streptomyces sp. CMB-StM0423]|nr:hypothetical protein CXR04_13795 [Streptomyces sp. CMB-StM0423]
MVLVPPGLVTVTLTVTGAPVTAKEGGVAERWESLTTAPRVPAPAAPKVTAVAAANPLPKRVLAGGEVSGPTLALTPPIVGAAM